MHKYIYAGILHINSQDDQLSVVDFSQKKSSQGSTVVTMGTSHKQGSTIAVATVGASGFVGAELGALINAHHRFTIAGLYVSEVSEDAGQPLSALYPKWVGQLDQPLTALTSEAIEKLKQQADVVCLCTEHAVAAELTRELYTSGLVVVDLSGAHRLPRADDYSTHYHFTHPAPELLSAAVYGLPEWNADSIAAARLIAVPGCYPTASLLALKPLTDLLDQGQVIINAVSGFTGAGRKLSRATHAAELSLQAYGVFQHRHQPEISHYSQRDILFTPHLGNFPRGILATIYATVANGVDADDIKHAFQVYQHQPCVRASAGSLPSVNAVNRLGYCDIGWHQSGQQLVLFSAIDNLLKGAASQALQCLNLRFGFNQSEGVPL